MPPIARAAAPRVTGTVFLACAFLAAAVGIQIAREDDAPSSSPLPVLWMRSPALMDRLALSFDALAADVYWIRSVLYYGSVRRAVDPTKNYDLLYPLLDITTTLDPQFFIAYRMGAIFLSEGYPGGPGRPDLAIALLEKGLRQDPTRWQLLHDIGFVYFWTVRDYVQAAAWLKKASEVPGAPSWLKPVVAGMLVRGGERATARSLWTEMLKSDEASMRSSAALHLEQIDTLDQIDELHSLIARVTLATGRRPESWHDLIVNGWLPGVPTDPSGTPYVMDPFTARVSVSPESRLFPMPQDLERAVQ
jgi:hypothetical protein